MRGWADFAAQSQYSPPDLGTFGGNWLSPTAQREIGSPHRGDGPVQLLCIAQRDEHSGLSVGGEGGPLAESLTPKL
jgi:hypothetical protein